MQTWKCPTCPATIDVIPSADMVGHKCPRKSHLPKDRQASWFVREEGNRALGH